MSRRRPCREWQAGGSCKFAGRCNFEHDICFSARSTISDPTQYSFTVQNALQPLIQSASGTVIRLGHLDEKAFLNLHHAQTEEYEHELDKRFIGALLECVLLPPCLVQELIKWFDPKAWYPNLYSHLGYLRNGEMHFMRGYPIERFDKMGYCEGGGRQTLEDLIGPLPLDPEFRDDPRLLSFGKVLQSEVRKQLPSLLSVEAAQNLGFARMARMFYIEQHSGGLQQGPRALAVYDVGGLWKCGRCSFPNEEIETSACAVCGCERRRGVESSNQRHSVPLSKNAVMKQMQKHVKKLRQVRFASTLRLIMHSLTHIHR